MSNIEQENDPGIWMIEEKTTYYKNFGEKIKLVNRHVIIETSRILISFGRNVKSYWIKIYDRSISKSWYLKQGSYGITKFHTPEEVQKIIEDNINDILSIL